MKRETVQQEEFLTPAEKDINLVVDLCQVYSCTTDKPKRNILLSFYLPFLLAPVSKPSTNKIKILVCFFFSKMCGVGPNGPKCSKYKG